MKPSIHPSSPLTHSFLLGLALVFAGQTSAHADNPSDTVQIKVKHPHHEVVRGPVKPATFAVQSKPQQEVKNLKEK